MSRHSRRQDPRARNIYPVSGAVHQDKGREQDGISPMLAFLFSISCGLAVANVYFAQPLLERLAAEFAIRQANIGLVMTMTQIGYGVGLLLLVPLGDMIDRRMLIVGMTVLSVLTLLMIGFATTGPILLASLIVLGMLAVVAQIIVAYASFEAKAAVRGRTVATVTSGIVIGILLARTIAGTLSDYWGWRSVYFASAAVTLIVSLLLFRVLPKRKKATVPMSYVTLVMSVFRLLAEEPVLRRRAVLAMLIFAAINMLLNALALQLASPPYNLSLTQIGLFGLAGVAGAAGASMAGRQADRGKGQRMTGIALSAMLGAWLFAAGLAASIWWLVFAVIIIDFGLQSVHVTSQSMISNLRPEALSRMIAAYMVFYSIGCAAGAIASTLIYAQAGWNGVCLAGFLISLGAIVYWRLTSWREAETAP